jgi:hypothetical protein
MRTFFLFGLVTLTGCTHHEPKPQLLSAPVPATGKRSAPVAVDAELFDLKAKLTLTFDTAASGVEVAISGLDALTVTKGAMAMNDGAVKAGERRTFEVAYTHGTGRANLVVSVRGLFGGAPLGRVVTFSVGEGPVPDTGTRVLTDDGQTLKVMEQQP